MLRAEVFLRRRSAAVKTGSAPSGSTCKSRVCYFTVIVTFSL